MAKNLIRGVNWIGDAVMTLPAIRALKEAFTEDEFHLLVKEWVSPVFQGNPFIDKVLIYSDDFSGLLGKIKAAKILKKEGYQRAFLFQNAFDAAVLATLSGIPEKIGYNRDLRGPMLTTRVPFDQYASRLHHCLYYLNILKHLGLKPVYRQPWIYLSLSERLRARERISQLKRPIILINPGATYGSAKRWPPERFSELIHLILNELRGSVIISGSSSEKAISEEILSNLKEPPPEDRLINLTGRTNLRDFIAILSEVDAVITNDSGPMHLAYATSQSLVALFGSTSAELTGPPSFVKATQNGFEEKQETLSRDIVIKKPVECSPCFKRTCPEGHTRCLELITPEEVFEALKGVLPAKKAIFFDRDGTLCRDAHYLSKMEDLEIFPEVQKLKELKEAGYMLVGVTNQSGIARGIVQEDFVREVNRIFIQKFGFDAFYYCPHHPDEHCACRKPSPGMLFKARAELGIDLKSSIVVGDKESDLELAKSVGAKAVLVTTGKLNFSEMADLEFKNLDELITYFTN